MFFVYILKSRKDDKLYIGSTNDLRKRLTEHNRGDVRSTHPRRPFVLVYYEAYQFEEEARKREKNIKGHSRQFVQLKKRIEKSLKI